MSKTEADAEAPAALTQRAEEPKNSSAQLVLVVLQVLGALGVGGYCIYASLANPTSVGFFCNDDSIRYPLLPETVPAFEASLIILLIPMALFVIVDTTAWFLYGDRFSRKIDLVWCRPSGIVGMYYQSFGGFVFAMLSCYAITFTAKICVGRLRPHFLDVCQPDWSKITCSDRSGFLYIDNYTCLGTDTAAIKEARVSFPSNHSSTSMCSMIYLILYLQSRLVWLCKCGVKASPVASKVTDGCWRTCKLLCPFLQLTAFALAFFIGLSRIKDRYHHPTDVLTGFIIGVLTAVFSIFYIAGLGSYRKGLIKSREQEDDLDSGV